MYPAPPIDQNNADAKNAPTAPMRFLDGTVADSPALTSPDTKDTMLRSVKSANAIRTTPITSRLMCDGEEAAPRASPRLAEVVTAMVADASTGNRSFQTKRRGWSLMIFCARATRGLRKPSLDARSERSISPHP